MPSITEQMRRTPSTPSAKAPTALGSLRGFPTPQQIYNGVSQGEKISRPRGSGKQPVSGARSLGEAYASAGVPSLLAAPQYTPPDYTIAGTPSVPTIENPIYNPTPVYNPPPIYNPTPVYNPPPTYNPPVYNPPPYVPPPIYNPPPSVPAGGLGSGGGGSGIFSDVLRTKKRNYGNPVVDIDYLAGLYASPGLLGSTTRKKGSSAPVRLLTGQLRSSAKHPHKGGKK